MKILPRTRTTQGPKEWFSSTVYIDSIKTNSDNSSLSISSVHFTPGARSAWHTHPKGQTLYVMEGVGVIQRRGGLIKVIRPGDVIWTEPDEEHWHGATTDHFMTHLAIQDVDEHGTMVNWGKHVTEEEYNKQPET